MTDKATGGARVGSNDWLGMTAPTPEMMEAASAVDIDWVEASECCCFSDAEIERLWHAMCTVPNSPVQRMRTAIERALADSESGDGWGPDVTVCGYLREALLQPNAQAQPTFCRPSVFRFIRVFLAAKSRLSLGVGRQEEP